MILKQDRTYKLTNQQIDLYCENGFLLNKNHLNLSEIRKLKIAVSEIMSLNLSGQVLENNNKTVRSINGPHLHHEAFIQLAKLPSILLPVMQIIQEEVYIHQYKVNTKKAFEGDIWAWHQDYIFWLKEDGMPKPRALNAVIFLDDVTEKNAPILLIPKSHKNGTIQVIPQEEKTISQNKPDWLSQTTASLKYTIEERTISKLVNHYGIVSATGKAGSVLFFDCNLVHSSSKNLSHFDRAVIIISYNPTSNSPKKSKNRRPEFISSKCCKPLKPSL